MRGCVGLGGYGGGGGGGQRKKEKQCGAEKKKEPGMFNLDDISNPCIILRYSFYICLPASLSICFALVLI